MPVYCFFHADAVANSLYNELHTGCTMYCKLVVQQKGNSLYNKLTVHLHPAVTAWRCKNEYIAVSKSL